MIFRIYNQQYYTLCVKFHGIGKGVNWQHTYHCWELICVDVKHDLSFPHDSRACICWWIVHFLPSSLLPATHSTHSHFHNHIILSLSPHSFLLLKLWSQNLFPLLFLRSHSFCYFQIRINLIMDLVLKLLLFVSCKFFCLWQRQSVKFCYLLYNVKVQMNC